MMAEFFSFVLVLCKDVVSFYFDLPFLEGISLGDLLVAIMILGVVVSALIGQLISFNLSHEARMASRSKKE